MGLGACRMGCDQIQEKVGKQQQRLLKPNSVPGPDPMGQVHMDLHQ